MDRDGIEEMFASLGPVTTRRLFGGQGVYVHGLIVAVEVRGEMLLKGDASTLDAFEAAGGRRWSYAGRGGRAVQMPYWSVPEAAWDDPEVMSRYVRLAYEAAMRAGPPAARSPRSKARH